MSGSSRSRCLPPASSRTGAGLGAVVALGAALAASIAAPQPAPAAAPGRPGDTPTPIVARSAEQRPGEVRRYWTSARLRAARPADSPGDHRPAAGTGPRGPAVAAKPANPPSPGYAGPARGSSGSGPAHVAPIPPGGARPAGWAGLQPGVARAPAALAAVEVTGDLTAYPLRTHGRVFFTITGGAAPGDYFCSATAVSAPDRSLVWTAGHCVYDFERGGGFATNWAFAPAYREGATPFGLWPARELFTTEGWHEQGEIRLDLGAASVARDTEGRGIADVLGTRGLAFGQPRDQGFVAFGYPAVPAVDPRFDGERPFACDSPRTGDDFAGSFGPLPLEIECEMTGGASGGGWVIEDRFVNSVTSYGYEELPGRLYGPYQGELAQDLFLVAGGEAVLCGDLEVTNLGTPGADEFDGTADRDSMAMRGGDDIARGAGGEDRLCGGDGGDELRGEGDADRIFGEPGADRIFGGNGRDWVAAGRGPDRVEGNAGADRLAGGRGADRLLGGVGRDRLLGGRGADVLIGGPGRDVCIGGPGRDRARGCEVRRGIP